MGWWKTLHAGRKVVGFTPAETLFPFILCLHISSPILFPYPGKPIKKAVKAFKNSSTSST